jgi:hypothetical protein
MSDLAVVGLGVWSTIGVIIFYKVMEEISDVFYDTDRTVQRRLTILSLLCGPVAFLAWICILSYYRSKNFIERIVDKVLK